jgi:RHS repeat-associated protein
MTHTGGANPAVYDRTFGYDNLGRLTSAVSNSLSLAFVYDASGNRTQVRYGSTTYVNTISPTSNRLSSSAGPLPAKANTFDPAGNVTSDGTVSYTFADRGRLKRVVKLSVPTDYVYNAFGERTAKSGTGVDTGANFYLYAGASQLVGEYNVGATPIEETIFLGDIPVAVLVGGSAEPLYVYSDHLGTPRIISSSSDNTIIWRWDSADPFGVDQPIGSAYLGSVFSYNQRFPGQIFDKETNSHYNYYRDYDPQTGRYIESDPIGLAAGVNTYVYVASNPISGVDVLGLAQCSVNFSGGQSAALVCVPADPTSPPLSIPVASGNNGQGTHCKNNLECDAIASRGPLPAGDWKWNVNGPGAANSKPNGRRLVPLPNTDTHGRAGFLTHSCLNAFGPSANGPYCSEGCITGSSNDMQRLNHLLQLEPNSTLHVGP